MPQFAIRAISLALRFHLTRLLNSFGILGETLSHLAFGGCRQDCFRAGAALFGMINRLLAVRVPEPLELILAQLCPSHLSGGTGGGGGTGTAAQHGCPDPNSAAVVFQCIWCQLTAACYVRQTAIPSFAWEQPFDCSGFHNATCSANKDRVRSIHWSQIPALLKARNQRAQTTR